MAQQIPANVILARKADDMAVLLTDDKPFVFNLFCKFFEAFYDPAADPAASLRPLK